MCECSDGSLLGATTVLVDLLHSFCQQLPGYNLAQDTVVGMMKSLCLRVFKLFSDLNQRCLGSFVRCP